MTKCSNWSHQSPTSTIVLHFLIFPKKSNHPLLHKMRGFSIIFVALMATATVYGADYGELCNGLLLQCNRYSETVLCMSRTRNETVGGEVCQVGVDVDLGRCQCRRNCGSGGVYILDGEFDTTRQKCVGFVEKSCQVKKWSLICISWCRWKIFILIEITWIFCRFIRTVLQTHIANQFSESVNVLQDFPQLQTVFVALKDLIMKQCMHSYQV